jgi:hypothetical protein
LSNVHDQGSFVQRFYVGDRTRFCRGDAIQPGLLFRIFRVFRFLSAGCSGGLAGGLVVLMSERAIGRQVMADCYAVRVQDIDHAPGRIAKSDKSQYCRSKGRTYSVACMVMRFRASLSLSSSSSSGCATSSARTAPYLTVCASSSNGSDSSTCSTVRQLDIPDCTSDGTCLGQGGTYLARGMAVSAQARCADAHWECPFSYYGLVLRMESACIAYAGTRGCLVSGRTALTCGILRSGG